MIVLITPRQEQQDNNSFINSSYKKKYKYFEENQGAHRKLSNRRWRVLTQGKKKRNM